MGIDAAIFAKNARRFFYFDRSYNFLPGDLPKNLALRYHVWTMETEPHTKVFDVETALRVVKGLTSEEVQNHARFCQAEWKKSFVETNQDGHRISWNEKIEEFAKLFPDDRFFIADDSYEPSWHDFKDAGFVEWLPEGWTA